MNIQSLYISAVLIISAVKLHSDESLKGKD